MSFACIFVPDFPVEAILRAEPELRSRPMAVLEGKPPLQKLLAVNGEARRAGILPGMTKLQVEGCTAAALRDRSEAQEAAAHRALLDCAQAFSPRVEDTAPNTVLLDLSGLTSLFGPLPTIARKIFHYASEMGFETHVAVASTIEAAMLAAHGFSGVTVIPEGKESEILASLPVEVLFAEEEVLFAEESDAQNAKEFLETLQRWGIRKLRDLAALPEAALSERLGQRGLEFQQKARGTGKRTLVPFDAPLVFEETLELEYPLVLLEPLAFLLSRMLEQLCQSLRAHSLAAQEVSLDLTLENRHNEAAALALSLPVLERQSQNGCSQIFQRTIHLPVPLLDPKLFLKLLQLDLKAHPPGAPIVKVHLRIEPAKPRSSQNGFFIPSSPEPEKLELTLARINSIVGENRAGSPQLLDTHRPQAFEMRHFRLIPVSVQGKRAQARTPTPPPTCFGMGVECTDFRGTGLPSSTNNCRNEDLVTALRIFRSPIAVRVHFSKGHLSHIRSLNGKQISGDVIWSAGPWRSSGDWWDQDAWVRDEWDIAVQEQTGIVLYRLIHDLLSGRWLLEGIYD